MDNIRLASSKSLNSEECNELAVLIEALTHSGQKNLDQSKLKTVKNICKKSDKNVGQTYHLVLHQLEKNHAEIRYSAFQICDEIFRRSHYFRRLVIENLSHIIELTAETNPDRPLPLPRNTALSLKQLALKTVGEWCNKYGPQHKKLVLVFNYLKRCKKVDFGALQLQSDAEKAKEEEKNRRLQSINKERVKKVEHELNDYSLDISTTVKSLMSCLDLLLPKPEEFFIALDEEHEKPHEDVVNVETANEIKSDVSNRDDDDDDDVDDDIDSDDDTGCYNPLRYIGAHNSKHSIQINLNVDEMKSLKETPENEAILENVCDHVKLIKNSYLPRVKGWLQILMNVSGHDNLMKKIVDLKTSLETSLEKYARLNIQISKDGGVSTDSELEEVNEDHEDNTDLGNKNDFFKPRNQVNDKREWSILSKEEIAEDPTTIQARLLSYKKQKTSVKSKEEASTTNELQSSTSEEYAIPSTSKVTDGEDLISRKDKLLAVAPKVPFDIDLYHWEDEKLETPTLLPTSIDQNKFWSSVSGNEFMEIPVPEGSSSLRTRVIEFVGEFKPVTKSCRAPLSNGKLCPRKDRLKCPFHGPIVSRDETGKCINPEDEEKFQKAEEEKRVPEWQDPKLLKEIKEATGIDLKMPEKGKRKKEKKYPGLTDLKANKNTVKNRLSKKLFNRASVKKIAETMDNIDHRRFRDKFGDQFHYMYNTA